MDTGSGSQAKGKGRFDGERFVAAAIVALFPVTTVGHYGVSLAAVAAIFMLPVTVRPLKNRRHLRTTLILGALGLACGPLLVHYSVSTGHFLNSKEEAHIYADFIAAGLLVLTLNWAQTVISPRRILGLYALGVLAEALLTPTAWKDDPWKYAFAWPITVLALCSFPRRWAVILTTAFVLSLLEDFRSFAGLCALGLLVIIILRTAKTKSPLPAILGLAAGAATIAVLGTQLALGGTFGASIQARTSAQTHGGAQSLILGARPEMGAARALAQIQPLGFGPGVMATTTEINAATRGIASLNGSSTPSEYVNSYLFGDHIELHSVLADAWAYFGPLGAVALLYGAVLMVLSLPRERKRAEQPVVILAALLGLWGLAFSPRSSLPYFVIALTLVVGTEQKQRCTTGAPTAPTIGYLP